MSVRPGRPRLGLHDGHPELERFGQHARDLGDDLLDDLPRLVERRADHRDREPERARATGDDRRERKQQHLGELDHALRGAPEREHLEDGRTLATRRFGPRSS